MKKIAIQEIIFQISTNVSTQMLIALEKIKGLILNHEGEFRHYLHFMKAPFRNETDKYLFYLY